MRLQPRRPIRIIRRTGAAGAVWRIAASFLRRNIFPREETCGIVAAAAIGGVYKIKGSGKSLNAAKCLEKSIQTAESLCPLVSIDRCYCKHLESTKSDEPIRVLEKVWAWRLATTCSLCGWAKWISEEF